MTASTATCLYELLEHHLALGADRPLLVTSDRAYSSGELATHAARFAHWLRAIGVAPGDRVVIDLKNGLAAVAALFGAARVGAIVVGASPQWMPEQLAYVLADCGARVLVTSLVRTKLLAGRLPPHVLVDSEWDALPDGSLAGPVVRDPEAAALVIYTSGSTGRPKGVVHPHGNLAAFAEIVAAYLGSSPDDRLMWLLGWSFGYGLSQLLTSCARGGHLILPASMMPADVVKAHAAHAATAIAFVPFGWDQLCGYLERTGGQLHGLRYLTNAGDGPSAALLARLPHAFPGAQIILMYGQTECFRTTYLPADQFDTKRGAMGYPIPGVEVRIVAEDGRPCGVDEPGELHHVGALVATGYWNDPAATARKFGTEDGRRFLRTGDLVRRDADGCLWYVGRSELVIKSSGFRFSPREIEEAAATHPAVAHALAFGVDDPTQGQAVELAVVLAPGATLEPSELAAHLRPQLPRYMQPRTIHRITEIPRTPNGKVDWGRFQLGQLGPRNP